MELTETLSQSNETSIRRSINYYLIISNKNTKKSQSIKCQTYWISPIDKVTINQSHRRLLLFMVVRGKKTKLNSKCSYIFFVCFLFVLFFNIDFHLHYTHNQNRYNNKHGTFFSPVFLYIWYFSFRNWEKVFALNWYSVDFVRSLISIKSMEILSISFSFVIWNWIYFHYIEVNTKIGG